MEDYSHEWWGLIKTNFEVSGRRFVAFFSKKRTKPKTKTLASSSILNNRILSDSIARRYTEFLLLEAKISKSNFQTILIYLKLLQTVLLRSKCITKLLSESRDHNKYSEPSALVDILAHVSDSY